MAGLRFGYLMAHPEIAKEIHKAKLPYNVNVFTLAAAEMVLERPNLMKEVVQTLLQNATGCSQSSDTPRRGSLRFMHEFLSHPNDEERRDLFEALYDRGVLVRDVSSYPMLERILRVTVGKPEENNRFLSALDRVWRPHDQSIRHKIPQDQGNRYPDSFES